MQIQALLNSSQVLLTSSTPFVYFVTFSLHKETPGPVRDLKSEALRSSIKLFWKDPLNCEKKRICSYEVKTTVGSETRVERTWGTFYSTNVEPETMAVFEVRANLHGVHGPAKIVTDTTSTCKGTAL